MSLPCQENLGPASGELLLGRSLRLPIGIHGDHGLERLLRALLSRSMGGLVLACREPIAAGVCAEVRNGIWFSKVRRLEGGARGGRVQTTLRAAAGGRHNELRFSCSAVLVKASNRYAPLL